MKAYCDHCKHSLSSILCEKHKTFQDTYYAKNKECYKRCSEINRNNDCKDFKPNLLYKMKKLISSIFTAILSTASNNPEETFIERKHHE